MPLDHRTEFAKFCHYDKLSGGPDAHISMTAWINRTKYDPVWGIALYVAVYNNPMGLVLLEMLPERAAQSYESILRTIQDIWPPVLRAERKRPVGSPVKLAQCIDSARLWINKYKPILKDARDYEELWTWSSEIKYFGRYAQIKLLEALHRAGLVRHAIPDIRAKGGWSAREGLAMLCPDEAELLFFGGDHAEAVERVEQVARRATREVPWIGGSCPLSMYELQVYLCNYKQCLTGKQYPGRSADTELDYLRKIMERFPRYDKVRIEVLNSRRHLFPEWALGEISGWNGVREPLTKFYSVGGRMWSDSIWDYVSTTDFENPRTWEELAR